MLQDGSVNPHNDLDDVAPPPNGSIPHPGHSITTQTSLPATFVPTDPQPPNLYVDVTAAAATHLPHDESELFETSSPAVEVEVFLVSLS